MFSLGLHNVKFDVNLGSSVRAAYCFGANLVVFSGRRVSAGGAAVGYQHQIPVIRSADVLSCCPHNHVPVAVELSFADDPISLVEYEHPTHAFYIFGAEDGGLPRGVISRCRDVVYIPTCGCASLNLSASINVVLYDRIAKGALKHGEEIAGEVGRKQGTVSGGGPAYHAGRQSDHSVDADGDGADIR